TPVTIDCNTLVSPQAVYDYNPNYGYQPDFTPAAGSDVATIVANQGVACNWVNQTSGVTFVIAVAQLAAGDLAGIRDGLPDSSRVSGIGDAAYFSASGGLGVAQVFSGPYWVVATSPAFYEMADPRPILDAALAALGR
ncbi:MAG TPA: arginyl-tRNA synthetase, partial [Homoserinimonas sp.]|nr:arginyl-tRNA synthetase [Homoserinimonas sp.]